MSINTIISDAYNFVTEDFPNAKMYTILSGGGINIESLYFRSARFCFYSSSIDKTIMIHLIAPGRIEDWTAPHVECDGIWSNSIERLCDKSKQEVDHNIKLWEGSFVNFNILDEPFLIQKGMEIIAQLTPDPVTQDERGEECYKSPQPVVEHVELTEPVRIPTPNDFIFHIMPPIFDHTNPVYVIQAFDNIFKYDAITGASL